MCADSFPREEEQIHEEMHKDWIPFQADSCTANTLSGLDQPVGATAVTKMARIARLRLASREKGQYVCACMSSHYLSDGGQEPLCATIAPTLTSHLQMCFNDCTTAVHL